MAHSIQVFRARSEVIRDLDLMVLFMFLPAAGNPKQPFSTWEHTLRHYGPGLIDLALDSLTEGEAKEFAAALHGAQQQIASFGSNIPRSWLHERLITPGVVFADYPVWSVIETASHLERLVSAGLAP